jgi:hypothetical protein
MRGPVVAGLDGTGHVDQVADIQVLAVDDPAGQCVIDLGQLDSVYYDRHRRAFAVEAGATLGRVYQSLDMSWGVTLPGGSCTGVGMGGHVTGGGFGRLGRIASKDDFRRLDQ